MTLPAVVDRRIHCDLMCRVMSPRRPLASWLLRRFLWISRSTSRSTRDVTMRRTGNPWLSRDGDGAA